MTLTRRSMMLTGAVAPALAALQASPSWAQANTTALVDKARTDVTAILKARGFKGAAVNLLVDGAPVWTEAFGETGGAASRPIDRDTIFSIQSTSKHMAATAVMMAVQRGLVDLDAPFTDYWPEFVVGSRHEPEPQRRMTLRHLLSHRAGFTHDAPVGNNFQDFDARPSFQAHVESIQQTWLRYPVGERHAYSNLGIDLAGHVLERVTGLAYPEILRRWIFEPLGMRNTSVEAKVYEANSNRAIGHMEGFDRIPVHLPFLPSGGVYSSVADMTRYAQFHLRQGASERRRLLDADLWAEMHDFRYGVDYALGVTRQTLRMERRTLALYKHDGGGFGFGSSFHYCPPERVAWVVLFNALVSDSPFDVVMPRPVLEARYGPRIAPPPNPNPIVRLPTEILQSRAGLYRNRDSRCVASAEDGSLTLRFNDGRGTNRLAFVGEDEAFVIEGLQRGAGARFHPTRGLMAAALEYPLGTHWDFIDGPSVTPGPVGSEYDDRLGTYEIRNWGKPVAQVTLSKRNGWLYYDDSRFSPFMPGLLFSGSGEALDLRGDVPTIRNIPLWRTA